MTFLNHRARYERERFRLMAVDSPRTVAEIRMVGMTPPDSDWGSLSMNVLTCPAIYLPELSPTYREFIEWTG